MSEPGEAPPRVDQPLIPPFLPRMIHRLALPIVLVWLGIVFITNTVAPQLEVVAKTHSVSMSPTDAASFQSMMRVGSTFKEFNSDNSAMILLEGDKPLGAEAHRYYDEIVRRVEQDKQHVQHVQDFWSDPLTAAGSQSHDQKAAYVQVYLAGNMGSGLANESAEALRKIVDSVPAPPGIKAYVTGAGPLFADQSHSGEKGVAVVTLVTFLVIVVMLLFVYRSVSTVLIMLAMVFIELAAARGVVATLGNYGIMGLSTFANNMLVLMAIAAGTDYAIFVVGRYQEARGLGETREEAFYTMFHSTAHVVLGSGLTIAGAMYCLSFCRLPYFESLGVPCAVGMLVAVLAALTLGPAMLTVASFFKLMDPKRKLQTRGWRRIGTAIVRWPAPVLAVTIAVALVGLLALPGYKTDYDNRHFLPADTPANVGYAAADRHFDQARLNPELLMIETDHDLRNPADFLVLDKVAKAVFHIPGIGRVQTITRPLGTPLDHSTLGFQMGAQAAGRIQTQHYQEEQANKPAQAGGRAQENDGNAA